MAKDGPCSQADRPWRDRKGAESVGPDVCRNRALPHFVLYSDGSSPWGVSNALPSSDQRGPYDMGQKWCYYAIHCDRRSPTSRAKEDVIVSMANGVAVYFSVQFSSNSALTRNKVLIWDRVEARLCGLYLQL